MILRRRVLRLILLAPDIVEAMLNGRQQPEMTLAALMRPFAVACISGAVLAKVPSVKGAAALSRSVEG
jgi:hypothetical protein